jgi:hypothetical protein
MSYYSNRSGELALVFTANPDDEDSIRISTDNGSGGYPTNALQGARDYLIRITGMAANDTFAWSRDGGTTWSSNITITAADTPIAFTGGEAQDDSGVYVQFKKVTGHLMGTMWRFTMCPGYNAEVIRQYVGLMTEFDDIADIVTSIKALGTNLAQTYTTYKTQAAAVCAALNTNVGGDLNQFMIDNTITVGWEMADVYNFTPSQVDPPPMIFGVGGFSAPDTISYSAIDTIDTTKYNTAQLEVMALTPISASTSIDTLAGTDSADAVINKTGPYDISSATAAELFDFPTDFSVTDRFKSVTGLTVTGGDVMQQIMFRTKGWY